VVVSTSGALVVSAPELLRASNAELFHSTQAEQPIGFTAAIDAVKTQDPEFEPAEIALKDGIFMLAGAESEMTYFVDAGGTLNGWNNLYGGVVGFLENLHDCALTCEGFAGYTPWLSSPAPVASLPPFEEMNWGAVLLAIAGPRWCSSPPPHSSSGGRACAGGATRSGSDGVGAAMPATSTCTT
jgi:hypothetical protein